MELLETLPAEERREITAWLFDLGRHNPPVLPAPWPLRAVTSMRGDPPATASARTGPAIGGERERRLAATLSAGEDSQLVTIRLPAERHAELRTWCAEHGFTMAAVVRGLVERFLAEQGPAKPATTAGSAEPTASTEPSPESEPGG